MTNADVVLHAMLECESADLYMLDGIEYDLANIIDEMKYECKDISMNSIFQEVFRYGVSELEVLLDKAIEETAHDLELTELGGCAEEHEENKDRMEHLKKLNPAADIRWNCNCQDTNIWFIENEDIYREYLEDAIDTIENKMGFSFTA